jgi:hypothetical protein
MKPLKCLALAAGYAHILHFSISYSVINIWCAYVYKYWPLFDCKFRHDIFKQLHSFPQAQDHQPIRRLKWATASLIVRAPVTPVALPIIHTGFEKVYGNLCISEIPSFFLQICTALTRNIWNETLHTVLLIKDDILLQFCVCRSFFSYSMSCTSTISSAFSLVKWKIFFGVISLRFALHWWGTFEVKCYT